MSQIIKKLQGGGNTPKKRIIKRGPDEVSLDELIRVCEKNASGWFSRYTTTPEQYSRAMDAYREIITGYDQGNVTPGLGNQSIDSAGKLKNLDDKNDPYAIAQTFIWEVLQKLDSEKKDEAKGKTKWDPNKGISQALSRRLFAGRDDFDINFLQLDPYIDGKRAITERWKRVDPYLNETLLDDYDMTPEQRTQAIQAMNALRAAYNNDQTFTANEQLYLSNLGLDDRWFYTGENYVKADEAPKTEEEQLAAELAQIKQEQQNDTARQQINAYKYRKQLEAMQSDPSQIRDFSRVGDYRYEFNWSDPDNSNVDEHTKARRKAARDRYNTDILGQGNVWAEYATSDSLFNGDTESDMFTKYTGTQFTDSKGNKHGYYNKDYYNLNDSDRVLASQKAHALSWLQSTSEDQLAQRRIKNSRLSKINGWYVIDNQFNDSGYVTVMSPDANKVARVAVADIISTDSIPDYLTAYIDYRITQNNIPSNKQGGILKAQFGEVIQKASNIEDSNRTLQKEMARIDREEAQAKKKALEARASEHGRDVETQKASEREIKDSGLTGVDIARMTAIGLDLASVVATLTGVGSIAGGAIGMGGTLTNLGADLADEGVSTGETIKNFAVGTGLSLLGLIPVVGGVGKLGKVLAYSVKWVPRLLTLAASGSIVLDRDVQNSLKKFKDVSITNIANPTEWMSKNNITSDDLRNLALAFGAVTGISRGATNLAQRKIVKAHAAIPNNDERYLINTKNKKGVALTKDQYEAFQKADTVEDANKILQGIEGQKDNAVLAARKYRILGKKSKFNKGSLSEIKGTNTYEMYPEEMTWLGKLFLGNPNNPLSDSHLILHQLNNRWEINNPHIGGLFFKGKQVPTTSRTVPPPVRTAPSKVQLATSVYGAGGPRRIVDLSKYTDSEGKLSNKAQGFINTYTSKNRDWDLDQIATYLKSINKIAPNRKLRGFALLPNYQIAIWKNGSRITKFASGGGIPKFDLGGTANILEAAQWYLDDNKNPYYSKRQKHFLSNGQVEWGDRDINASNNNAPDNLFYDPEEGGPEVEATKRYQNWITSILTSKEDVARHWAKEYLDRLDPNNSKTAKIRNTYYNAWYSNGQFNFDNFRKAVLKDKHVWDDAVNGIGHDFYWGHVWQDEDGKYYSGLPDGYEEIGEAIADPNNYILVHKFKKSASQQPEQNPQQDQHQPDVDPTIIKGKNVDLSGDIKISSNPLQAISEGLRLDRLFGTLHTNTLNRRDLARGLKPVILDTYNLYHPIYGDYAGRINTNGWAAQTLYNATLPTTSDSSLAAAVKLEANKQAEAALEKAMLADNAEIKRTEVENRKRYEDNTARWSQVGNQNRERIYQNRNALMQLYANARLKNWNAIASYLQESQLRADKNLAEYRNQANSYYNNFLQLKYKTESDALLQSARDWARANGKSITDAPDYKTYLSQVKENTPKMYKDQASFMSTLMGWPKLPSYNAPYNIKV